MKSQTALVYKDSKTVIHKRSEAGVEIKIFTHINKCKKYPYASKRQNYRTVP